MKVSFDFDTTLDKPIIQEYAIELIERGVEVWIHTLRVSDKENDWAKDWNKDLYQIADYIGISRDRIVFCNMTDKWEFLVDEDFIWHIDDDSIECKLINRNTNTIGICHIGSSTWRNKCERLLNQNGK